MATLRPARPASLKLLDEIGYYTRGQASSLGRYILQELVTGVCGGVPSLLGIALRAVAYRAIIRSNGFAAIEHSVRIAFAENITLGKNVYLDHGVYLHACPGGIDIGDDAFIMHNAELHVFNFRNLRDAFIRIGARSFVGESVIVRGQGGVDIGAAVLIGPRAQILAINHNHGDPETPILDQGITCKGIVIEDGAWIGAGALILDGVRVGRNAVVGAGAVVTKDVPANCVAVGVPARVIESANRGADGVHHVARLEEISRVGRAAYAAPARVGRF
ncbi:MAG: acyltransferase [Chloroflexi bacterium]|nr:acyltransferase [Chloroflexota bacterium]